jgi:hypothetical protein
MMQKPLTTEKVMAMFPEDPLSETCSKRCPECNTRIWFQGSWGDADIPKTFRCPHCKLKQTKTGKRGVL